MSFSRLFIYNIFHFNITYPLSGVIEYSAIEESQLNILWILLDSYIHFLSNRVEIIREITIRVLEKIVYNL